jgi:glycosyltransferase involved in cell wall biosynthesis
VRVLHFIYDDRSNPWVAGGGAVRAFEIYRRLAAGVSATVVTGNYPGASPAEEDGVRFLRVGRPEPYAWSRLSYGLEANRMLRAGGYDAAVFDYSAYTPIFLPRGRPAGMSIHHLTGPTARARWGRSLGLLVGLLERAMVRRARWISLSAHVVEAEVRALSPEARLEWVGAGVAGDFFEVDRSESDYVLFFGRLDVFQKGLDTVVEAFRRLRSTHPALRLCIAGRGKDARAVARLVERAELTDAVEMLGPVSDGRRLELLAGALLVLMPSRFEGFGLVAAEAMAAGVPVVASDAGSLPEVLAPPYGGVTVPIGDPAALAAAAGALLDDPDRRRELSLSAREQAQRFTWDAVAERHHRFLRLIAGSAEGS